ncbi:uncharacterized protein LOC134805980 [Cydia splendana]|uniref:uncharacterized protein LOC134805980 n=1 Tax=Cydia splendana TaxID=1100963 RepID=UPI00300D3203
MGNLPAQRIKADFPFTSTAVDLACPYLITDRRGRGCKITKCYLCLFICLRYKCVHLEAVSDLSKDAFVLALRRFIARRGKPAELFCDNGRSFVAAAKEINVFFKLHENDISDFAASQGTKFKFAPAYAPNFNGYAEAGIKSAKFHLKRVLGNTHLTFEELSSLFSQVEAILNSRPLCPLSSSPNDFYPLTPGHFLIFRPLTSLPAPPLQDRNPNRLDRFLRLEQLRQHFWKRWSAEFVSLQQQRYKWRERQRDLQLGELVLIKEEGLPPLLWRMGRVVKLHNGKDGVPRVADINTARGIVKRALNRICLYLYNIESPERGSFSAPEYVSALATQPASNQPMMCGDAAQDANNVRRDQRPIRKCDARCHVSPIRLIPRQRTTLISILQSNHRSERACPRQL